MTCGTRCANDPHLPISCAINYSTPNSAKIPVAPPLLERKLRASSGIHSDSMAGDTDNGPPLNDGSREDVGRLFLPLAEEVITNEFRLDGLGGGTSRLARCRRVDTEITCVYTWRERGGGLKFLPEQKKCDTALFSDRGCDLPRSKQAALRTLSFYHYC